MLFEIIKCAENEYAVDDCYETMSQTESGFDTKWIVDFFKSCPHAKAYQDNPAIIITTKDQVNAVLTWAFENLQNIQMASADENGYHLTNVWMPQE